MKSLSGANTNKDFTTCSESEGVDILNNDLTTLPNYGVYKSSGVEWLGEIPNSWELKRFKFLLDEINDRSKTGKEDLLSVSQYTGVTRKSDKVNEGDLLTNAESLEGYKKVSKDDLVSNIMLAWNGSLGISPFNGITSPAYSIYRFRKECAVRFYHYLLRTEIYKAEFKRRSTGVIDSRLRLYSDDFFDVIGIFPSIDTQVTIANFLDKKTALIDEAITIKKQQIELLKDRKKIIIQQGVTQGINPKAQMKDSGVDWIGNIPEHWDIKRAKYLFIEIDVRSINGDEELLSVSHITGVTPRSEKSVTMVAENYSGSKMCKKDDLVMNIMWAWMGALGVSDRMGIVSSAYSIFRQTPLNIFNPIYLEWLLKTIGYIEHYNRVSTGLHSSRLRFYSRMFFDMKIGYPSREEQDQIVSCIEKQSIMIDQTVDLQKQQIEKLKEYKTTLINSAVTGKIKVPSVS